MPTVSTTTAQTDAASVGSTVDAKLADATDLVNNNPDSFSAQFQAMQEQYEARNMAKFQEDVTSLIGNMVGDGIDKMPSR